jgi:hypothetical protein
MIPPTSKRPTARVMAGVELAPYSAGPPARGPLVSGRGGHRGAYGGGIGEGGGGAPIPLHGGLPCDPLTLEEEGDARPPHTTYQYLRSTDEGVPHMREHHLTRALLRFARASLELVVARVGGVR